MDNNTVAIPVTGVGILEKKDADKLYAQVGSILTRGGSVVVDFENAALCHQDFLEGFICRIYKDFNREFLDSHFKIINFWQLSEDYLNDLIRRKGR